MSMAIDDAARLLCAAEGGQQQHAYLLLRYPELLDAVWRRLQRSHHPDVGGDPIVWGRLESAHQLLTETEHQGWDGT